MMDVAPALLEYWLRDRYFTSEIDISGSGVENFSFSELRELVGLSFEDLDQIVFRDSRSLGAPDLRAAIARRWGNGDPERAMANHGSSEAIFLILNALLRAGDEVVVLDPGYHSLSVLVGAIGCQLKAWHLRFARQFVPDIAEAQQLITPRTRMVIVNFPHNPTGASVTLEQQATLIRAAADVDAYLLWDAAFTEITYDHPPLPDATTLYDRAISVGTLSKAYGLPGLRFGWCLAAPDVLERCVQLRDYMTLHLSPMVELVAQRVIEHGDRLLTPRLEQARRNRAILAEWVAQQQGLVEWAAPQGGVTAFVRFPGVTDIDAFCQRLSSERGVLVVPGSCFQHPDHVRLGFGGPTAELEVGLERLSGALHEHGKSG